MSNVKSFRVAVSSESEALNEQDLEILDGVDGLIRDCHDLFESSAKKNDSGVFLSE